MFYEDNLSARVGLYPQTKPYFAGFLSVGNPKYNHQLYYEQSGNPDGLPVLVSHGGPGNGLKDWYRQFFDPKVYRIIMFDQRGAGKSTPFACLDDNTIWHIVRDMELLRSTLKISKWVLFGGSWGACVSLAYAVQHSDHVHALVLRGVFSGRRCEMDWMYQPGSGGIENVFPDRFEAFVAPIPEVERNDVLGAYHRRIFGKIPEEQKLSLARTWAMYEMSISRLHVDPEFLQRAEDDRFALAVTRIELHHLAAGCFFHYDGELLDKAKVLEELGIPGVIVSCEEFGVMEQRER